MDAKQQEQLQNEQIAGGAALVSYQQFIKGFVDDKRASLFEAFRMLPITAELELMEVKRMLFAVDTLEQEIVNVIDTGKMASKTLADNEPKSEEGVTH